MILFPSLATTLFCRLSLISFTSLNQYGHDHDKTMTCASCRLGGRGTGSSRMEGWLLTDKMRQEYDVEWHFCRRREKKAPCSDKNLLSWWLESVLVCLLLSLCVCVDACVCVCVDELHDNYVCISLHNKVRKASRLKYCCVSGSSDSHVKLWNGI